MSQPISEVDAQIYLILDNWVVHDSECFCNRTDDPNDCDCIQARVKQNLYRELTALLHKAEVRGKDKGLDELLEWHNEWFNTHDKDDPFNWYGAVRSLQTLHGASLNKTGADSDE